MAEGVERFEPDHDYEEMEAAPSGDWVRYSDYETLEAAFDKQTRTAWRLEREVEEASDRIVDARDQARQQVLEEVEAWVNRRTDELDAHPSDQSEEGEARLGMLAEFRDLLATLDSSREQGKEVEGDGR